MIAANAAIMKVVGRAGGVEQAVTKRQKDMLAEIAEGTDVNMIVQCARLVSKSEEHQAAKTILALFKQKMLQCAKGGGLEISTKGSEFHARALVIKSTQKGRP